MLEHVAVAPDAVAFTFLDHGEPDGPSSRRTYADLHARAAAVAAALREVVAPGERALLLFPPGLEFIDAFLGCLYAGVVAVPAYPPDPARLQRTLPRLVAITESAGVGVVLTQKMIAALKTALPDLPPSLSLRPWIAVDALELREDPDPPALPTPETLAFLQYTSGSTAEPRGVMISHGNLAANAAMILRAMDVRPDDVGVSWLPLFHDMGLIGTVLSAIIGRVRVHLMSPLDFLKRPLSWLQTISAIGATHSGGPNFAYALCARRATPEDVARLDLSRWRLAFNGAEPIDPAVLDRFVEVFAPAGFRREALFPTYGLAEATLMVSGGPPGVRPTVERCSPGLLERGVVDPHPEGRPLLSSGRLVADSTRIISGGVVLPNRRIGEIWVRGPHVARGYWGEPEATADTFGHRLADGSGEWMRTGDLGFIHEGRLFVTGRIKDLIIVHGRNIYPHDIERVAEGVDARLQGRCAAFGVPARDGEAVGMVIESDEQGPDFERMTDAVRRAVSATIGVAIEGIVPVPRRGLPKTSSGKLQHWACRELYLERRAVPQQPAVGPGPRAAAIEAAVDGTIWTLLVDALAERSSLPRSRLRPDVTLAELGVDSVVMADLAAHLESRLGRSVDVRSLDGATLGEIAGRIARCDGAGSPEVTTDWRTRDLSHFQAATGHDLFEVHEHFARWSSEARPGGYGLYDQALTGAPATTVELAGGEVPLLNLASYNYLGLSTRPEVIEAAADAARRYGLSASGSPLLSGLLQIHGELERALAEFKQVESVLLFPTGYVTNVGVISALTGPGDVVIADALAHASIVDGVALSRARMVYFRHNDAASLERALQQAKGRTLVAVEGVYSMDGDLAPLPEIAELCRRHGARLLVDEAHSAFVFGARGRGAVEHFGVEDAVDVHVGTLSKSLGGMGGYVGGSARMIDYVRSYARARTFSCALAPPVAGGLLAAVRLVQAEPELRQRLWRNVEVMREALVARGVDIGATTSQVIPVLVHDDDKIFEIARALLRRGVYLNPVRYPAVKKHHARFRISVSAAHDPAELRRGAELIGDVLAQHGVIA